MYTTAMFLGNSWLDPTVGAGNNEQKHVYMYLPSTLSCTRNLILSLVCIRGLSPRGLLVESRTNIDTLAIRLSPRLLVGGLENNNHNDVNNNNSNNINNNDKNSYENNTNRYLILIIQYPDVKYHNVPQNLITL